MGDVEMHRPMFNFTKVGDRVVMRVAEKNDEVLRIDMCEDDARQIAHALLRVLGDE